MDKHLSLASVGEEIVKFEILDLLKMEENVNMEYKYNSTYKDKKRLIIKVWLVIK